MSMMSPLTVEGKPLDVAARLAELTGVVAAAARDGLPAHVLEQSLWRQLLRLGHDLQAAYFALAGDGDCGETLKLADGRVVRRLPEPHGRPYQSIFGDFTLERVVYGTREGQRIEAAPLDARLGLPAARCSYLLRDWNQALVVENPYAQVDAVLERILGLKQSVASLETMTRTLAKAVAGYEAARPPAAPATGAQIVVLSADGKGVPLRKPADAPAIAAHDHARGPKPDRKKMAVLGAAYQIEPHVRTPLAVVESLFSRSDGPLGPTRSASARPPSEAGVRGAAGGRRRGRGPGPTAPGRGDLSLVAGRSPPARPRPPPALGGGDGRANLPVGRRRRDLGRGPARGNPGRAPRDRLPVGGGPSLS